MKSEPAHAAAYAPFSGRATDAASTALDRRAVSSIQRSVGGARLRFVLWDGFELSSRPGPPVGTILFRNRVALVSWLWDPELYFGEAYMSGAVEIGGDVVGVLEEVYRHFGDFQPRRSWWRRANDRTAARANVHHHYDLGNAFYALWLDRELLYTCAYFPDQACSLEAAQLAKMDLVCRKLGLQPGERVVEAGSGWGSLALFMARKYGARVRAFNVSTEQVAYARERAAREGLADRVEFVEDDFRNIRGRYDAFVSLGMLEHVGLPDYETFAGVIDRSLVPDGRGLLHFIGRNVPSPLNAWIRKRIFPGAYAPTLGEVCDRVLEPKAFSVLDVENLRLHYARTLAHWLERFERHAGRVERMFDAAFVRAWRLYLAGSEVAFTTGWMQLFQVVFSRGTCNRIPWTRRAG